jgi:RNA polymerase sigma factor (sigma-70 family)
MYDDNELTQYISQIKGYDMMTPEQELDLLKEMVDGDEAKREDSKNKLVTSNLRLALKESIRYNKKIGVRRNLIKELVSAANMGLMEAAKRFDPEKAIESNSRFSTYATYWIRNTIRSAIDQSINRVKIPNYLKGDSKRLSALMEEDKFYSDEDLMDKLDVNESILGYLKKAESCAYVSMESECQETANLESDVCDPSVQTGMKEIRIILEDAISNLDEISQDIVINQMLSESKMTLNELGEKHNVTREAIRLKRNKALVKLNWILKQTGFNGDVDV